jgi:chromosome segregation protein
MYLKRIDIQGFKSFADRISLKFGTGITSIVGPNGSGKSNIADAIRWVLGEQSAKTLRGSKMEDVIFSGTEHRKPLGFAEVSITIENSDGILPIEYNEVTVTRRVFRSGESEYLLNKTLCRLKDINELFVDTGIGRDGYSVIAQGKIDEILSTRSEDRRDIFEEASGIMKYKMRKLETERKLELTRQNLLRINDIILELESQLVPLKEQSEKAKKYLNIREQLKELEVNLYIENITKLRNKIEDQNNNYEELKQDIENQNKKLEETKRAIKKKNELSQLLEEKLNNSKQNYHSIEGNIEKNYSNIKINEEKIKNLEDNITRLKNEMSDIEARTSEIDADMEKKKQKINYLNQQYNEFSLKLKDSENKMEKIMSALDKNERYIEELKSGIYDKMDVLSDKKNQTGNIQTHINSIIKRQENIEKEVLNISIETDKERMLAEDLEAKIRKIKDSLKEKKLSYENSVTSRKDLAGKLDDLKKMHDKLKSDISLNMSRYKMLKDMEAGFEGYNRSVREILKAGSVSEEFGGGIHGTLAQLINVDKKYETAIEMALGSAIQNIVTTNENYAKKAIEYLKRKGSGRATFLPLTSIKGKTINVSLLSAIRKCSGFIGIAHDIINYDSKYENIVLNLLGRVAVFDNIDNAIEAAKQFSYGFRIVTLEGDILNTGGSITGGSIHKSETGILGRRRNIERLNNEIKRINTQKNEIEKEISVVTDNLKKTDEQIHDIQNDIKEFELTLIRDESKAKQINENIAKTNSRIEMLKQEKNQLTRQLEQERLDLKKYDEEILSIQNDLEETKKVVKIYSEKHKNSQLQRDEINKDIMDYKISVNSIKESIEGINEVISRLGNEYENIHKGKDKKKTEINNYENDIIELRELNKGVLELIRKNEEVMSGKTFEIDRTTEERKSVEEEIIELSESIDNINETIISLQENYRKIEVRKTKYESDLEVIQNRLWEEYELTFTNAFELKKDIGSLAQAQKIIEEYKKEIKELGSVNTAAIEDYIKTKERYEFMNAQQQDMEKSRDKLRKVINEMISIMKNQFMEQFKIINKNFNIVFKELFDGGRAKLRLTDEDNILESGIEIEAQPPGKRLQNMLLLSGGERAFTAIALLFAILKLKPVPFCVLDEIEAALDDANVYRFIEYLRNYSEKTQFIMVTHRKGTMEGSDMLYGVTMEEHGISKIVSMKMEGEKQYEAV